MTRYEVFFEGSSDLSGDELESALEALTDRLVDARVIDPSVSRVPSMGEVSVSVIVEADGFEQALHDGEAVLGQIAAGELPFVVASVRATRLDDAPSIVSRG